MFREIVEDLKQASGGRLVMTPAELELVLGVSVGQQANLRSQSRFPIKHQKIGSKIVYPIHAIAKHLSSSASDSAREAIKVIEEDRPLSRTQKKKMGNHLKGDWMLSYRLRLFALIERNEIEEEIASSEVKSSKERLNFRSGALKGQL
jgi:hypothetical protein